MVTLSASGAEEEEGWREKSVRVEIDAIHSMKFQNPEIDFSTSHENHWA